MPVDFDLTAAQKKLKYETREFAREVLRPAAQRADGLADPQEAFLAMKPVYEQVAARGLHTMFLPVEYGGGSSRRGNCPFRVPPAETSNLWISVATST